MFNFINFLSFMDKLQEWSDGFKSWIMSNYGNPILWVGILAVAFIFFKIMFNTLDKD